MRVHFFRTPIGIIAIILCCIAATVGAPVTTYPTDDYLFIHHSSGGHWLLNNLRAELYAKDYVDEFNDIGYTSDVAPDDGRPDSLTFSGDGLVPGDHTDMCHWVRWFNDYLGHIKTHGCANGVNRVVMFKSCYPNSNVGAEAEPGDPFADERTISNYKAIFRHPSGPGNRYTFSGTTYKPLEDVFAENPDTLFIYVTAPPLLPTSTNLTLAARAREFNNWVKTTWLDSYNAAHPGLNNVVVFDWFGLLAIPEGQPNANMLRPEYATGPSDNHPSDSANSLSTRVFATDPGNFLDTAWNRFVNSTAPQPPPPPPPSGNGTAVITVYPNPYRPGSGNEYDDSTLGRGIVFNGLNAQPRIRIFTLTGELVRDIEVPDNTGRYIWDATDSSGNKVASGVYVYLVTYSGTSTKIKGRLSIVR